MSSLSRSRVSKHAKYRRTKQACAKEKKSGNNGSAINKCGCALMAEVNRQRCGFAPSYKSSYISPIISVAHCAIFSVAMRGCSERNTNLASLGARRIRSRIGALSL
jgi:hypothetical protein